MNTIPYGCDYVPNLFDMSKYNEALHVYYDTLNSRDLKVCHRLITKILNKRGYNLRHIEVKPPKGTKTKAGKSNPNISDYFSVYTQKEFEDHASWFEKIMTEDWNYLFSDLFDQEKTYYVYCHADVLKANHLVQTSLDKYKFIGTPFYIGKGKGDRMNEISSRSNFHKRKISGLLSNPNVKRENVIYKIADELTEKEAFILESKLISYFGTVSEIDKRNVHFTGIKGGILINSEIPKRPDWISRYVNTKKIKIVGV